MTPIKFAFNRGPLAVRFVEAFWHLVNFILPAVGVSAGAALGAKLLWRRELAPVAYRRLLLAGAAAGLLALLAGLVLLGRDGAMASYGLLLAACAGGQWWFGFGPGRR